MLKKIVIIISVILMLLVFISGCSNSGNKELGREDMLKNLSHDIEIEGMSYSIGGKPNETTNKQIITYNIILHNWDIKDKYIKWVEPVLNANFTKRVSNLDKKIIIEKRIPSDKSINISFKITFNSEGLSKEEIINLKPYVTDIKIITENVLSLKYNEKMD